METKERTAESVNSTAQSINPDAKVQNITENCNAFCSNFDELSKEQLKALEDELQQLEIGNIPDESEPKALYTINDVPVLYPKSIALVVAQKKSGKTNSVGLLMCASIIKGNSVLNGSIKCNEGTIRILVFDTEQPDRDARQTLRRVMVTAGYDKTEQWNKHDIRSISLRNKNEKEMQTLILVGILRYEPKLVVIDGIADVVRDINNQTESKAMLQWMATLAEKFNCCILGALHLNPGTTKATGWLGTQGMKKFTDCIIMTKKDGSFTLSHEGRGRSPQPVHFKIADADGDGIGKWESVATSTIEDVKRNVDNDRRATIADVKFPIAMTELAEIVAKKREIKIPAARNYIKDSLEDGGYIERYKVGNNVWFNLKGTDDGQQELF
jgi:hypothetical protein